MVIGQVTTATGRQTDRKTDRQAGKQGDADTGDSKAIRQSENTHTHTDTPPVNHLQ